MLTSESPQSPPPDGPEDISWEERAMELVLVVGLPLLITFIAFGVIVLAFSQWKLY